MNSFVKHWSIILWMIAAGIIHAENFQTSTPTSSSTPNAAALAAIQLVPKTVEGEYFNGKLEKLNIEGRKGYVVIPYGAIDPERRWVMITPYWLGMQDGFGVIEHRFYVEALLQKGFHVAGVDVGVTFGSPAGAEVFQKLYEKLVNEYHLNSRARMIVQSNGGLIGYAWAFRHPQCVERIFGICPVMDYFTWPPDGLNAIATGAEPGLGYGLSTDELNARATEFNPIDNLKPLAEAGVKTFHIHGDQDKLVPLDRNSAEMAKRFEALGGHGEVEILSGLAHGGQLLYDNVNAVKFLTE